MSEISKGALTSENNNSFPNNNTGYITPTILRTFNQNMIDSLVDEIGYTADSASFNSRILAVSASAVINTGSFATTSSLNALSSSIASTDLAQSSSIAALQEFSSSLDATFATDAQLTALSTSIAVTDSAQSASIAALQSFSSSLDATFATDAQLTALSTSIAVTDAGQDSKINSLIGATGSYVTEAESGSFLITASFSSQTLTFTKGNGSQFSLSIPDVSGSTIDTGSFATTGSNIFIGNQIITGSVILSSSADVELQVIGNQSNTGSLSIRGASQYNLSNNTTVNPTLYLSESVVGSTNWIRGWGEDPQSSGVGATQANFTGSVRITGSNNILSIPQIRPVNYFAGATAEMTGYISGSGNFINGNQSGIFLNSSSLLLPKTTGNQIGFNSQFTLTFTTSSLSGGHPIFNNNTVQGGNFVINHPSGTLNGAVNSIIGGTITSSQAFVTNVRPTISGNQIWNSTSTLRHISGSITFNNNLANSALVVENHMSSSGITNNGLLFSNNSIFGGSSNTGLGVYVSGSQSSNATRTIIDNLFGGKNIIVSSSFVSSSNSSLLSSLIYGQGLAVNANHGTSAGGTAFVGRFNDTGSNLGNANDIVFAVGTGTSASARKTGLWIDSGSVTNINGGLLVTGSTTLSGSLFIASGSAFFANGNRQFNVGAFQSNVSQSGSANVSQSMNFEVTDISSGVSIVSNSRITLANSGTYNIQFSAQTQATGGADNLYIWLKKNGTNVTASAGNVELINNQEVIAAWNYVVDAAAGDYFELAWQAGNIDTILLAANASGNIPSIPSIILTVTQVR